MLTEFAAKTDQAPSEQCSSTADNRLLLCAGRVDFFRFPILNLLAVVPER